MTMQRFILVLLVTMGFGSNTLLAREVRVFIHGTALFTNKPGVLEFWNNLSIRKAYNGPYLGAGLIRASSQAIDAFLQDEVLPEEQQVLAATHVLGAYQGIANLAQGRESDVAYYVMGWSGGFAKEARLAAAQELYAGLRGILQDTDTLTIIAHSHGGSVALHLAEVQEYGRKPLVVDNLLLYGTPLAEATARLAYNQRFFKRVVNFYSQGDHHQGNDCFSLGVGSTLRHLWEGTLECSKTTFAAFHLPRALSEGKRVFDVRLLLDGNDRVFSHNHLFAFDRHSAFAELWPLPLSIVTPLFTQLIDAMELLPGKVPHSLAIDIRHDQTVQEPAAAALTLVATGGTKQTSLRLPLNYLGKLVETSRKNYRSLQYWLMPR